MGNKRTEIKARYDAKSTRRFVLKLNLKTDEDIIATLLEQESMQGYIKQAIREKMERERG